MSGGAGVLKQSVVLNHLIPFLSIIDYINLRRALVRISPLLINASDLLLRRFERRLEEELHLESHIITSLVSLLTHEGGEVFLSGGFLVSLLRGDAFQKEQDLDLYFCNASVLKDTPFDINSFDGEEAREDFEYPNFLAIYSRIFSGVKIQFIQHKNKNNLLSDKNNLLSGIARFDIPICRNMYSKSTGLRICHSESLTRSSCVVDVPFYMESQGLVAKRNLFKNKFKILKKRVEKYRLRGFNITFETYIDEEDFKLLFKCPIEHVPFIGNRNEIFRLMGAHNPPSCIYSKDCRCASAGDPAARFCTNHFSKIHCDCEHHVVFYQLLKVRWTENMIQQLWEEYEKEWKNEGGRASQKTKRIKI